MKKVIKLFEAIIDINIPLMLLIFGITSRLFYNSVDDSGGWGGLAIAAIIFGSIIWIAIVKLVAAILSKFIQKDIGKIIIAILNLFVYQYIFASLTNENAFIVISIATITIYILYLILIKEIFSKNQSINA